MLLQLEVVVKRYGFSEYLHDFNGMEWLKEGKPNVAMNIIFLIGLIYMRENSVVDDIHVREVA